MTYSELEESKKRKTAEVHLHKGDLNNLPEGKIFCCVGDVDKTMPLGYCMWFDYEADDIQPLLGTEWELFYANEEDFKGVPLMLFFEVCICYEHDFYSLKEIIEDRCLGFEESNGESFLESLVPSEYPFDIKVFDDDQDQLIATFHIKNFDDVSCDGKGI